MRNFIFACLVILICRLLAAHVFCTFDDAFVSYRYAQNLVSGYGMIYNLNEKVLGTTAPLFAIIGTLPLLFSLSVPKFFVVFNACCDIASLYLIFRFVFKKDKLLLILFTILFSLDPAVNRIAAGGMEANLFLFCSLLGVVLYFNSRKYAAFVLLAGIYFLRPEAIILFLILICYEWFSTKKMPWKYLLCCLILVAPVLFMMNAFYGHIVPQSVIVKGMGSPRPFSELFRNIFFPHLFNYFLFPLAIFGMLKAAGKSNYLMVIAMWFALYSAAYCIRGPWILNWYIYAIEVSQLIFAAVAMAGICSLLKFNVLKNKFFAFSPLLSIIVWVCIYFQMGRSGIETNIYDQLKIDFGSDHEANGKVFFADDIGALGFYTRGYIYDNLMLVTPQAVQFKNERDRILNVNPDYLFLYADRIHLRMLTEDTIVAGKYSFLKRYSRNGEKLLPENAEDGITEYRQDYILWKRKH